MFLGLMHRTAFPRGEYSTLVFIDLEALQSGGFRVAHGRAGIGTLPSSAMSNETAPMNFAAAMERKSDTSALRNVQLNGLAVLKILKHCKESMPSLVTGQLLGLDIGQTLEVTDCFPFPVSSAVALAGMCLGCFRVRILTRLV